MLKLVVVSIVLLSSCAYRTTAKSPDELSKNPRDCREPVYSTQDSPTRDERNVPAREETDRTGENVFAVIGLVEVAVREPGAFQCKPEPGDAQEVVIKRPDGSKATEYKVERP